MRPRAESLPKPPPSDFGFRISDLFWTSTFGFQISRP
jgi:hypothetical protein